VAFPTTSVLTSFTGSDEDPLSESGNWTGPFRNGGRQCERVVNAAAHSANPDDNLAATSYWQGAQFGPDVEVFATIPVVPDAAGDGVAVWGRIHNPGNATTMEGYIGHFVNGTGWRIFKCLTGSTFTQVGSTTASPAPTNGEKLGLEIIGTALKLYHFTAGSWVERVSGTDSSITGSGYIGIEFAIDSANERLDDFGGGAFAVGRSGDLLVLGVA
jgi:hypothetical protein